MKIEREKKKLMLGIFLDIFICIIAFIILFFSFKNKSSKVASVNTIPSNNSVANNFITVILDEDIEEIPEIVTDEKASNKELKEQKVTKKEEQKSNSPYYIKVNYKANVVTIYTKDKDGKYTVPYKAMVCSCGTYTPKSGTYKTSSRYKWGKLIHDVYGQYATRIVGSILFHSVPYSSNKADTLLYNEYDKLGTTASAGCVRLTVADAKWIYDNCPSGTMVEFYSSSETGPLGKPSAQKISAVEECRNWDPTDPASNNPWHTYNKKEEEKPNENIQNNITNDATNTITNNAVNETINNTVDNSIVNNLVNDSFNNTIDNSINNNNNNNTSNNNIANENINNSVVDNSTVDNSSSTNNTTANTNTNSTVSNNTIENNVDNSTVNNSTVNDTTNTNNTSNNLNNNNSSDTEHNSVNETNNSIQV